MVVRRLELSSSWRFTGAIPYEDRDKKLTAAKLSSIFKKAKADPDLGAAGVAILRAAYAQAKARGNGAVTGGQMVDELRKVLGSLANDRAKGRVNDGYVDAREAATVKGDLAKKLFAFYSRQFKPTKAEGLRARATFAQIDKAFAKLSPIVDAGFKAFKGHEDDFDNGPGDALRKAAAEAKLPPKGRATLMTALNGATTRSDGGEWPTAEDVKWVLRNAVSKLKASDGALIVDFARANRAPASKKDKVVTGLEVDRTPAATGNTLRAMLEYAQSL
jgi:hypothetical protein